MDGRVYVKWNHDNLSMPGPILGVTPTSAEPLLWASVWTAGELPLFTRNRVGNGTAYALTATESALAEKPDLLHYVWTETIGEPLWKVEINPQRYLVAYPPAEATVRLARDRQPDDQGRSHVDALPSALYEDHHQQRTDSVPESNGGCRTTAPCRFPPMASGKPWRFIPIRN